MQPLGLTKGQHDNLYLPRLMSPHDFDLDIDVLDMNETVVGTVNGYFKDGQVNVQRDGTIKRTATFTCYDPDHALHLDNESPFTGAVFANRMVRARHSVVLAGVGRIWATPFVGPVVGVSREGDDLTIQCQDKTLLAIEGCVPKTVKTGHNAVDAIEEIMRERTGERRFRFPANHKRRLTKSYSVGWKADASPWRVCQKIASNELNMELQYSCDGALMLRRKPKSVAVDLTGIASLTGAVRSEYDITTVRNYVRVTGDKKKKVGTEAPKKQKHTEFTVGVDAPRSHPMSPQKLGRHGVNRYLPLLIEDSSIKKEKDAQDRADSELAKALPMGVRASFSGVPLFHLDYGDLIRVETDYGRLVLPFLEGSIPLGLGGDAEFGAQRRVSRPRRR